MTPTRNALVQDCGDRIQRVWVPARPLIVQPAAAGLAGRAGSIPAALGGAVGSPYSPACVWSAIRCMPEPQGGRALPAGRFAQHPSATPHRHAQRARAPGGPMTCCGVRDRPARGAISSGGCPSLGTVRDPRPALSPRQGRAPSRPGRSERRQSMRSRCDSRMQRQDRSSACLRFAPVA